MRKKTKFLILALVIILLTGCGNADSGRLGNLSDISVRIEGRN